MKRIAFVIISIAIGLNIGYCRILNVPEDFQTIQAGIDAAEEGDTVLVQPGVYRGNFMIEQKSIFLLGNRAEPESVVLDGSGDQANGSVILTMANANCRTGINLAGLTLCNGSGSDGDLFRREGGAIMSRDEVSKRLIVEDCIIRNNTAQRGAAFMGYGAVPSFERVHFFGNNGGTLISISYTELHGNEPFLNYCLFDSNTCGSNVVTARNITGGLVLVSNTVFTANMPGRAVYDAAYSNTKINNSIIWFNAANYIFGYPREESPFAISFTTLQGGRLSLNNGIPSGDGFLDADPLFLDPDNGDYRLSPDSPCIDSGDPDSPLDPDGTRADMGAFYFHQRDIEADPLEVLFNPTGWEEIDSQFVEFTNVGLTDLHLTDLSPALMPSFIFSRLEWSPDAPITIPPDSTFRWWLYFHPRREGEGQAAPRMSWTIFTDDPDEDSLFVTASGDILSGPSDDIPAPSSPSLSAFPNPFNSSVTISYSVGQVSKPVSLAVYDTQGRLVADLSPSTGDLNRRSPSGEQNVVWEAGELPAGVYVVRLEADQKSFMNKIVLVR